jgi:hypothetical protein
MRFEKFLDFEQESVEEFHLIWQMALIVLVYAQIG